MTPQFDVKRRASFKDGDTSQSRRFRLWLSRMMWRKKSDTVGPTARPWGLYKDGQLTQAFATEAEARALVPESSLADAFLARIHDSHRVEPPQGGAFITTRHHCYFVDFAWWDERLMVQLDHPDHRRRDSHLRTVGYQVFHFSRDDVCRRWYDVESQLLDAGAPVANGPPGLSAPQPTPSLNHHFSSFGAWSASIDAEPLDPRTP